MTDYIVQKGDTLTKIANATGMSISEIANKNGIKNVDKILIGQKLVLNDKPEQPSPAVSNPTNVNPDELQLQYEKLQAQYNDMQKSLADSQKENSKNLNWLEGGIVGGAMALGGQYAVKKAAPALTGTYHKAAEKTANAATTAKKKASSAKKTAVKNANKFVKTTTKKLKKTKNAAVRTYKRSENLLNGKRIQYKGQKIKLGKASKVLGKAAVPVTVVLSAAEIGYAYKEGGSKAAVKQGAKCATGIAAGWAGAKVGAAIGTAICPGIGTAIGGFIGGIGGYFLGDKIAGSVIG